MLEFIGLSATEPLTATDVAPTAPPLISRAAWLVAWMALQLCAEFMDMRIP